MSRDVKIDIKQLKQLRDNLQIVGKNTDDFLESCAKELAARLLAKVIKRTPVDKGTLRRAWSTNNIKVSHVGSNYVVEIINPTEYASYVEYGHRQEPGRYVPAIGKRLKKGWVEGQFMLTISEEEIRQSAPGILEKKVKKWLSGAIK